MRDKAIILDRKILQDFDKARKKEWLLTNGLGGYASSTIMGMNTRGYHGLLVASFPHLFRVLLLSKMEEEVKVNGNVFQLSTNKYPDTIYPKGYNYIDRFEVKNGVSFFYVLDGNILRKDVLLANRRNAVLIRYEMVKSDGEAVLNVRPLINCRDHHLRTKEGDLTFRQEVKQTSVMITPEPKLTNICISYDKARYRKVELWYKNMTYEEEMERGLAYMEDHFCPGELEVELLEGEKFEVIASACSAEPLTFENQAEYAHGDFLLDRLRIASEQFLVSGPFGEAIIAGYHWFGEWGRDTAISIPGLLLIYGKNESAKNIIMRYLSLSMHGIIPSFISEKGEIAYNSVDTSLWFIYTVYKYYSYTDDAEFVRSVFPKLKEIIMNYKNSSIVHMNDKGLIECVEAGMTWMDALVDGVPATGRKGMCVEVNALWYNALKAMEEFASLLGEDKTYYGKIASYLKRNFQDLFWYGKGSYLCDYIDSNGKDYSLRPNQIFCISLPFPLLEKEKWVYVLNAVEDSLFTPYGLRTLDPSHHLYRGKCRGNQRDRDLAYHNGTVWAWLLGPYITAKARAKLPLQLNEINACLRMHMLDAGLGNISEIFDGDPPHAPRGCIAQAWSVAEITRALYESGIRAE